MFSKAIVFFALVAVAVADRPQVSLRMPPILPPYARPLSPQVAGGEEAPEGTYPFIVSLQLDQHFCAGSILNENWIVTAAHCCTSIPSLFLLSIKAGKHNIEKKEDSEQTVKATKMYIHEKFRATGPDNICVLELASPLKLNDKVQAIELPAPESEPTGDAWLCGWGSTSITNSPRITDKLQHVKLKYLDLKTCSDIMERLVGYSAVNETDVCTAPSNKLTSACSGDSGGPLISRYGQKAVLTGIVSWGIYPCGADGAPYVYTGVSHYNDWIEKKIAKY